MAANQIFGFMITSASGESAQIGVEAGTNSLYVRTTQGGAWKPWTLHSLARNANNEITEKVLSSAHSETTNKLVKPVKITFSGGVTGSVSFDGSSDVTCSLSLSELEARVTAIEKSIENVSKQPVPGEW